jgi:serine phosphatase RsbU (regulator of sigma subunit)
MGQTRSMLRQAVYDHPDATPAQVLTAFENANSRSGLHAAGSAVVVQLRHRDGRWTMQWTNAGHPPPILLLADGTTTLLDEHDMLFGFGRRSERRDHHRALPPGATLLLYTDGLVERRDTDIDAGIDRLCGHLRDHRDEPVDVLVATTLATLTAAGHDDDVVAFAIRIPR